MTPILIYMLGLMFFIVVAAAVGFFWAVRSGQFEDLEGPAQRILMDDDDPTIPRRRLKKGSE